MSLFIRVAVRCGRRYLSSSGPSSRLEEKLTRAGARYGFKTEVFATPTGVFVSCVNPEGDKILTLLDRIKESTINLSELARMEAVLDGLASGQMNLIDTWNELETKKPFAAEYPIAVVLIGAFFVGGLASFTRYGDWKSFLFSGLLTIMAYFITGPLVNFFKMSGIFCDFLGSLIALSVAGVLAQVFDLPAEALAIGAIVLIVPGLTLTTAISELADHNFASGTVKLMKGILTLLAMATAYLLVNDLSNIYMPMASSNMGTHILKNVSSEWIQVACNAGLILSFGIIFHIPKSAIPWATLAGMLGWIVLKTFQGPQVLILASYFASTVVGVVSLLLSRWFHLPSQIYSVPGILSLLPGMLALSSVTGFGVVQGRTGSEMAFHVAVTATSIVFGLFTARLPIMLTFRSHANDF